MQLRAEIGVNLSDHREELELSKEQCQRLLKQNGALLEQLSDLEDEMEARFGGFSGLSGMLGREGAVGRAASASASAGAGTGGVGAGVSDSKAAALQIKKLSTQLSTADAKTDDLNNEVFVTAYLYQL